MKLLFLCLLASFWLINADDAFDHITFFNGRRVGGMVQFDSNTKKECEVCEYTTNWFQQKLDHFEPSDTRTWQQKYNMNYEFYDAEKGGPVFLMIGGEAAINSDWMTGGQWVINARKHGAMLFQLEHRYYGESRPTKDLNIENIKYLSSEQALADLAAFIVAKNEEFSFGPDVKWIVFGGSYPGNLAAWLRAKYPHLVHGAVASSAPVLAKVDFQEYYAVTYESLRSHSEECVVAIKDAVDATNALFQAEDYKQLGQTYNLCQQFTKNSSAQSISMFYITLAGHFANIVQNNDDNINAGTSEIDQVCGRMTMESIGSPIKRLAALFNNYCIYTNYDGFIQSLRYPGYQPAESRQWIYQTCTEFGYFQTLYQSVMFTDQVPLEYWIDMCKDGFDNSFDAGFINRAVNDTNTEYGQLDINATRIVFVHGTIDPWHALGITKTTDSSRPAILIEGGSHCADMQGYSYRDLPQMVAARQQISEIIASWLEAELEA